MCKTLKTYDVNVCEFVHYTQGEVTSYNQWSRYNRHFVGVTRV